MVIKDGCGRRRRYTRIGVFKDELAWATDKQLWVISNIKRYLKQLCHQGTKECAILNIKQYCMHCYVVLSNVF